VFSLYVYSYCLNYIFQILEIKNILGAYIIMFYRQFKVYIQLLEVWITKSIHIISIVEDFIIQLYIIHMKLNFEFKFLKPLEEIRIKINKSIIHMTSNIE